jgi:PAS domain S-box-containing protein
MFPDQPDDSAYQAENAALRQRLALAHSVLGQLDTGLQIVHLDTPDDDRTLRLFDANNAAEHLTGRAAADTLSTTLDEAFPTLRAQGVPRACLEAIRSGTAQTIEQVHYPHPHSPDGTGRMLRVRLLPLFDDYLALALEPATSAEPHTPAPASSEAVAQALVNCAPDTLLLLDTQGTILALNAAAAQRLDMSGFLPGSLTLEDIFAPDVAARRRIWLERVQRAAQTIRFEDTINDRTYENICAPILNKQGAVVRLAMSSHDITARTRLEDELRQSKLLLQHVLDRMPAIVFVKDAQRRYLLINQYYERILRLSREHVIGCTNEEIVATMEHAGMFRADSEAHLIKHIVATWQTEDQNVLETGRIIEHEETTSVEGELRTYLSYKFPLYDQQGHITGIGGVSTDITARRNTEEALQHAYSELEQRVQERTADLERINQTLREEVAERRRIERELRQSQTLLQSLIDHSPAAIYVKDTTGRYMLVNHHTAEMLGRTRQEIVGCLDADLFTEPEQQQYIGMFRAYEQQVINTNSVLEHELNIAQGGHERTMLTALFPICDTRGNVTAVGGITTDMTRRKQDEQELSRAYAHQAELSERLGRSRDLLQAVFDGMEDGLVLLDGSGTVQTINRALATLLGTTPAVLTGQHWLAICKNSEPTFPCNVVLHTLNDYRAHHRRERVVQSDEQVRICDMQTLPLLGSNGMVDRIILHIVDVTERLEFEELAGQHEKFAASGKLAAAIAHEVNTPLQAIQNFLYLAGQTGADQRDSYLALVSDEIDRISSIVRQLLDLYRTETQVSSVFDINTLINRVLLLTGGTLAKQRVSVERRLTTELPQLQGRADQITQVLLNLIINAADAMPGGGTLTIETHMSNIKPTPDIQVTVSDTGTGISEQVQKSIFESFFTTKPDGTGLGLAISRKIISQHDGTMHVHSVPGQGSTFCITLPLHNRYANAAVAADEA